MVMVVLTEDTLKRVCEEILIVGRVTGQVNGTILLQKQKIYVVLVLKPTVLSTLLLQFSPPFITASMLFP